MKEIIFSLAMHINVDQDIMKLIFLNLINIIKVSIKKNYKKWLNIGTNLKILHNMSKILIKKRFQNKYETHMQKIISFDIIFKIIIFFNNTVYIFFY